MNLKERLKRLFEKLFVDTPKHFIETQIVDNPWLTYLWGDHLPNKDDKFEVRIFGILNFFDFLGLLLFLVLLIALANQYLKPRTVFLIVIIYALINTLIYTVYEGHRKRWIWVFILLLLIISVLIVGYIFYPLLPEEL